MFGATCSQCKFFEIGEKEAPTPQNLTPAEPQTGACKFNAPVGVCILGQRGPVVMGIFPVVKLSTGACRVYEAKLEVA